MNLLTSKELVQKAKAKVGRAVPPMAHQSYPIPMRRTGSIGVIFVYCIARPEFKKGLCMLAPSHRALLNAADGELLEVKSVEPKDLGVNDPPQKILGFWKMPPDLTTEEYLTQQASLYRSFDLLMPMFAGRKKPASKDAATFNQLFKKLSETPLLPYYKAIGADFFSWLAATG